MELHEIESDLVRDLRRIRKMVLRRDWRGIITFADLVAADRAKIRRLEPEGTKCEAILGACCDRVERDEKRGE